jgi:hypothetical protein
VLFLSTGSAITTSRKPALIGRETSTPGSPREISRARRRFSSISGPGTTARIKAKAMNISRDRKSF